MKDGEQPGTGTVQNMKEGSCNCNYIMPLPHDYIYFCPHEYKVESVVLF